MAGSVIGALRVNLGLDSADFTKGAKNAETAMKGMSLKMNLAGAAIGAALGAAAAGFIKLTKDAIDTADEISKSAVKIGISTEELSRLRYAADLSGLSFEQLEKGLLILNRNLAGVGGESKKVSEAFTLMGIETRNADGSLKSSTEVLKAMADVFKGMPDGAQKSALAMAVLGKSGADMIPLINGGSDALAQLTDEADQFGIVIDTETGRKAEEFNDNLSRLEGAFGALATKVAAEMLPTLVDFTNTLIDNAGAISSFAGELSKAAQGVGILTSKVIDGGKTLNDYYLPIVEKTREYLRGWGVPIFGGTGGNSTLDVVNALKRAAAGSAEPLQAMGNAAQYSAPRIARISPVSRAASSSLRDVGRDARETARDLQTLMDKLFPYRAASKKFADDMAAIQKSRLSDAEKEDAIARLERQAFESRTKGLGDAKVSSWLNDNEPLVDAEKQLSDTLDSLEAEAKSKTVVIADTFAQMSERITSSLQGLANSIRSGDFLGILGGVLNLFSQLGSVGAFGKTIQANLNKPIGGARAMGGPVSMGKQYLVGENGPEMFAPGRSGTIIPNHAMGRTHVTVGIDPANGNITAFVNGQIAATAPVIAGAGAAMAQGQMAARARRRVR